MGNLLRAATIAFVLVVLGGTALAGSISDTFDGPTMDHMWSVAFGFRGEPLGNNTSGWNHSFQGGALVVDDITPIVYGSSSSVTPWSRVRLETELPGALDFDFSLDLSWGSAGGNPELKTMALALYDSADEYVGWVVYHDAWIGTSGEFAAFGGGQTYNSLAGTLPHSGSASFAIRRTGGQASIIIDGQSVLSFTNTLPVATVAIHFDRYPYSPSPSPFDHLAAHDFQGTFTSVPLPGSALLGLAGLLLLGIVRRRRAA